MYNPFAQTVTANWRHWLRSGVERLATIGAFFDSNKLCFMRVLAPTTFFLLGQGVSRCKYRSDDDNARRIVRAITCDALCFERSANSFVCFRRLRSPFASATISDRS